MQIFPYIKAGSGYGEISTYGDIVWIRGNLCIKGERPSVQIFPYIKAGSGYEEISTYGDIVWIWGNIFTSQTECAEISTYGDFVQKWGNILTPVHRLDVRRFLHTVTHSGCGEISAHKVKDLRCRDVPISRHREMPTWSYNRICEEISACKMIDCRCRYFPVT